jgi:TonB family protein
MRLLLAGLLTVFAAVSAIAQELPQSVTDAYQGYVDAAEERDLETALGFAYAAWQEGEAAGIDDATLSILASNYAQVAGLLDRHADAIDAYRRAISLHISAGNPESDIADFRTEIARALLRDNDLRDAIRQADENIEYFDGLPAGSDRELGLYFNRVVAALASHQLHRRRDALTYAEPAIAYVEQNDGVQNQDIAYLAFVLARSSYDLNRFEDAAYYGALAHVIGRNVMPDAELVDSATSIVNAAGIRGLELGQLDELQTRVLSSNFRPHECPRSDVECTEHEIAVREQHGDYIPSVPMFRIPPEYPRRAAHRSREGYVDVVFSVNEAGRTVDVEVLHSTDRMFNDSAIASVEEWRYWPALVNGEPWFNRGVQTRIEYQMAN